MKKLDINEVKARFLTKGLILDSDEYFGKEIPMNCHDEDGYKYKISLGCVCDKRTKKIDNICKANPYSLENIQKFIDINGGKCRLKTKEYISSHDMITMECKCEQTFDLRVYHLIQKKKFICNECSLKIEANKRKTDELITVSEIESYGYTPILIENRHNVHVMDSNGYCYNTSIYNLSIKKDDTIRFSTQNIYTVRNMLNYLKINNIDIKMVNEEERKIEISKDYIEWYCVDCGKIFKAKWGNVSAESKNRFRTLRCRKCSKSQSALEYLIEKYLIEKEVEYLEQYKFYNCKNILPLPFDFYLPKYNQIIEAHGSQHYVQNPLFSQTLEERQRIDRIKKEYCKSNDINFLEIPYYDIFNSNKYKVLIDNILNQN